MLKKTTLEELKGMLLEEKNKLEKDLDKIATKTDDGYKAKTEDLGREEDDNAEEMEEKEANQGLINVLSDNLKEVDTALERMEKGTYGHCENCNEEIPVERLRAYPAATSCVKCTN
jgi:DnaK suppressor protein